MIHLLPGISPFLIFMSLVHLVWKMPYKLFMWSALHRHPEGPHTHVRFDYLLYQEFVTQPLDLQFRQPRCITNRFKNSFVPSVVCVLNDIWNVCMLCVCVCGGGGGGGADLNVPRCIWGGIDGGGEIGWDGNGMVISAVRNRHISEWCYLNMLNAILWYCTVIHCIIFELVSMWLYEDLHWQSVSELQHTRNA